MPSALAGLASVTAALGNLSRAREMAALVYRHPATERVHRVLAERLLAGREPPALEDLEPQGLEETVRALLREAG